MWLPLEGLKVFYLKFLRSLKQGSMKDLKMGMVSNFWRVENAH